MLSLTLGPDDNAENRLVLQFGDWRHACQEYYFALDRGIAPGDESDAKIRRVLVRLLDQWCDAIRTVEPGGVAYLPFDLEDQATAWLRVTAREWGLILQPGWSEVEGWSFFPSDFRSRVSCLTDFDPLSEIPPLAATKSAWLGTIAASRTALLADAIEAAPHTDPTPIFEHFRGSYGAELLTAAVAHFNLFGLLAKAPATFDDLRTHLTLDERPARVLVTALQAMGLLTTDSEGRLTSTPLAAEHLVPGTAFDVGNYVGLAASAPGVLEMVDRLRTNRPAGSNSGDAGTAFIYREGVASAMEQEELARHFTLALAGRARNVAPFLAEAVSLEGANHLLDVAGGTGLYAIACLQRYPGLRAVVLDRPEVLKVAEECREEAGVASRLHLHTGDMFHDPLPRADVILLSNVLHDWDVPECRRLIARCVEALPAGGRLLIHDVFLDDDLAGPLPIALYSAALFTLTEGRAYSAAEYCEWLTSAGLTVHGPTPTLIHCGVLAGTKP
ncbi:MAG: methyltransferase domain-containing protein [Planctomycetaceae bacterium]|nr:methyltransferase domain-containing protein [Planctomycetaceae bacterium]